MKYGYPVLVVGAVAALCGAAAAWKAYPRLHHVTPHADVREKAILSQASQGRFETVILGDSLVELSYLPQICGAPALNAGLGGATIADVGKLGPDVLRIVRPKRVIIAAGVNDAAPIAKTDPALFRASYAALIRKARQNGAAVYVATIAPVAPAGRLSATYFDAARIAALNDVIRTLGVPVISLAGLGDASGRLPQAATDDGVHLVPAAYGPWDSAMGSVCRKAS